MIGALTADFTPNNRRALALVMIAILVCGIMVGLTIPLISLMLNARGLSPTVIGLNTAMLGIASLVTLPLLPGLVARFSMRRILITSILTSIGCFIAYVLVDAVWAWFLIRFTHGVAHTALFALSEFWINHITPDKVRGRILGLYSTLFAGGLMIGPLILLVAGAEGPAPFLTAASLMAIAALPFILARPQIPAFSRDETGSNALSFMRVAPALMLAALVFGLMETGLFQLIPVYAVRAGNETQLVAWMMTIIGAGNMAFQLPIGWLADRFDRSHILLMCCLAGIAGGLSLPYLITQPHLLFPAMFVWTGLLFGLYTVGLAIVGDRYQGAELLKANSAYVLLYSAGTLIGPVFLGAAMDIWDPEGFPAAIVAVCLGYAALIAWRTQKSP